MCDVVGSTRINSSNVATSSDSSCEGKLQWTNRSISRWFVPQTGPAAVFEKCLNVAKGGWWEEKRESSDAFA